MCRARGAAGQVSCEHFARPAAAKGACGGRRRLTCASRQAFRMARGCGFRAKATLGAKIEVPTIDGRSIVRIPPGTNSGKTLRLKEKGVPSARNGARGDQYVEIQVVVPPPTDERVRNLMKELESVAPGDPRKDLFSKAGV